MRLWIIDEMTLRNKHNINEAIKGIHISCIEIPEQALLQFKTAYELWLEEKKRKGEVDNEIKDS